MFAKANAPLRDVFADDAGSHHEDNVAERGNVLEWIPVYGDEIGIEARRNGSRLVFQPERFG